jgi:hypothetical protein
MRGLFVLIFLVGCGEDHHDDGVHADGPTIMTVAWTHAAGCVAGTAGDVTIVVTAIDPNDPQTDLTVAGTVSGCTGSIDAFSSTVNCPNAAAANGSLSVSDPEPHTAMATFTIMPCMDGSVSPE